MDLSVVPLPLILPPGISSIPLSICACAQVRLCTDLCVYLCCYLFAGPRVFPSYPPVRFLEKSILNFDVGSSDGGDGRSQ